MLSSRHVAVLSSSRRVSSRLVASRRLVVSSSRRLVVPSRLVASRCSSSQIVEDMRRSCKRVGNIMIVATEWFGDSFL